LMWVAETAEAGARAVGSAVVSGTAATVAAVALGTVVGTAAVTIAVAKVVNWAEEEGVHRAQLLAVRDGFAARLAFDVTGRKQPGELKARIAEWNAFADKRVTACAIAGYNAVEDELARLSEADLKALLNDLGARFGSSDFSETKTAIFRAVGGWDKEPDTLTIGLASLPR
jgi:hypothetical protein